MKKRFSSVSLCIVLLLFITSKGSAVIGTSQTASLSLPSRGNEKIIDSSSTASRFLCSAAIIRGLNFLKRNQVKAPFRVGGPNITVSDYPGDWPQFFSVIGLPELQVREVSPFMTTFIHHALTFIVGQNLRALGLQETVLQSVRDMRQRAVAFMQRFQADKQDPAAGTFGFWPLSDEFNKEETRLEQIAFEYIQGPILGGDRIPINIGFFPAKLAIPSDADDTATIYASLMDDSLIDDGTGSPMPVEQFFADWRDLGKVQRRLNPEWLPPASGAFLTWLSYHDPPNPSLPNDVDLVVNANILYTLARYEALDTPGSAQAVDLINSVTQEGLHRLKHSEISDYYPDNFAFYYCVSRAYYEGPVPDLQPAVTILADDLEALALTSTDGSIFWDKGSPHLNTAFAVLTLLNAGRAPAFMERAIDYLLAEQHPVSGCWDEGVFFIGRSETGLQFSWASSSLTTAIVVEALCRYQLALQNSATSGSD